MKVVFLLLVLAYSVSSARILAFFPFPTRSHQAVFKGLNRELARKGHEVVCYTPLPLEDPPPNYKEILIPDFSRHVYETLDINTFGSKAALEQSRLLFEMGAVLQRLTCQVPEVRQLIESNEKFDAVILESLFYQEGFSAFQHKFGAIGIELQTLGSVAWVNYVTGNPFNPSYILDFKSPYTNEMTFSERLMNTVVVLGTLAMGELHYLPIYQRIMDECFNYTGWESRPPISDLIRNKSLTLINSHFTLGYPVPLVPNVVEVGGLNLRPNRPLPEDVKRFMDEAEDGVVFFSLGSNLDTQQFLGSHKFQEVLNALKRLKFRVLMKLEKPLEETFENIMTSKWLPQPDILAHPKCQLFITHGGFLSITEAVNNGVPMIGIPCFGDQRKNVKNIVKGGFAIHLDPTNITDISLSWAINEALTNPRYKFEASKRSAMFRNQPMSGLDTAIYWVNYVTTFGGSHLHQPSTSLRWWQILLIDVLVLPIILIFLALYLVISKLILGRPQKLKRE